MRPSVGINTSMKTRLRISIKQYEKSWASSTRAGQEEPSRASQCLQSLAQAADFHSVIHSAKPDAPSRQSSLGPEREGTRRTPPAGARLTPVTQTPPSKSSEVTRSCGPPGEAAMAVQGDEGGRPARALGPSRLRPAQVPARQRCTATEPDVRGAQTRPGPQRPPRNATPLRRTHPSFHQLCRRVSSRTQL